MDDGIRSRVAGGKHPGPDLNVNGPGEGSRLENDLGQNPIPNNIDEPEPVGSPIKSPIEAPQMSVRAGRPGRRQKREDEAQGNSFANFDDMLSTAGGLGGSKRPRRGNANKDCNKPDESVGQMGSNVEPTETNQIPSDSMDPGAKKIVPMIEHEEIAEENEDEDQEDDDLPKNESQDSPEETKTFFMYKAKSQFPESDKLSLAKLKQIKKLHKPMNYNKLRKLGKSYIADMQIQTVKKQEELKQDLEEREKSYVVPFISKNHESIKANFKKDNVCPSLTKKQEFIKNSEIAKKYSQKISELATPSKLITDLALAQRFPSTGTPHTSWYFGRFGATEILQNSNLLASQTVQATRHKLGAEYLTHNKKFRVSNEILQARKITSS
jgi:hypothetical protein